MRKTRGTGKATVSCEFLPRVAVLRRFLFPVLFLAGLLAAGCVTTQEAAENRNTIGQLQVQVSNLERDMGQFKEQIGNVTVVKENQTSVLSQTSELSKDLQALRGRFEENKYFQDKALKDMMSEIELLKARVAALDGQSHKEVRRTPPPETKENGRAKAEVKQEAEGGETGETQPVPARKVHKKEPESAAKLYDEAHIALKEKKFAESRRLFERFIKNYPKEGLAGNAYFWIGETYYAEKKYEDAILSYEDFQKKYPKHDKVKSAMLKQGYSFLNLSGKNNKLAGKDILESLIEKYPKSREAELAKKRLKEVSKANPSKGKRRK
jgi:tol-pal system protein YbgF